MNSLIAWVKGLLTPTDNWVCHYWRMDDPERITETFPTQAQAHECELKRSDEGYITLVRFEGTTNHDSLVLGAIHIISGAISSHKSLAAQHGSELANHVRGHLTSGRGSDG